jgi:ribonuclease HI
MIYTNSDGGARGNPGPGAIGLIVRKDGQILTKFSRFIGENVTNNFAEYKALIRALEFASRFTKGEVTCILDSELVVKQLLGEYKVKNPGLLKLFLQVQELQDRFKKIRYLHTSRWDKFQQMADELVNQELDSKGYYKYKYKRRR